MHALQQRNATALPVT